MAKLISLSILAVVMGLLGMTFYRVLSPFILPMFLAGVVCLLGRPINTYFLSRTGNRNYLSAGLTTTVIVASVMIPFLLVVTMGALQLYVIVEEGTDHPLINRPIRVLSERDLFQEASSYVDAWLPVEVVPENVDENGESIAITEEQKDQLTQERITKRADLIRENVRVSLRQLVTETFNPALAVTSLGILGQLGSIVMAQIIFVMALYYFFAEGKILLHNTEKLIPVDVAHQRELFDEFSKAVRAVVVATMAAAFAQGILTALALWILGYGHFFLFTILSTIAALIPLAGTWLVWLPFAIALLYQGDWGWSLGLFIYGFVFVGTLDNVIRTMVLQSDAKLHPLLAFVSVIGGLQMMGLWGVFIAPIVASCLHASVKIFNQELKSFSTDPQSWKQAYKSFQAGSKVATVPAVNTVSDTTTNDSKASTSSVATTAETDDEPSPKTTPDQPC